MQSACRVHYGPTFADMPLTEVYLAALAQFAGYSDLRNTSAIVLMTPGSLTL